MTAAIVTIAKLGYGQASLARIAATAGTSKSVILYYFSGKDDHLRVPGRLRPAGHGHGHPRRHRRGAAPAGP